ncbi:MAG: hypothetical protein ACJ764_03075 [Solirubrobacteraceae bacterium]
MTRQSRFVAFGSAGLLVVIGAVCGALVAGTAGQILALVLIGGGLVLATGLVFLEVGLSEDRERAREERRPSRGPTPRPARARLNRSRSHRRHLEP